MSTDRAEPGSEPSYGDALDELEDLLDDLEGADVDVDVLAERVARGVELIRLCRARLDVVTADVDAVVAELVAMDEPARATTDDAAEPTEAGEPDG